MLDQQDEIKYERPLNYSPRNVDDRKNLSRLKLLVIRDKDLPVEVIEDMKKEFNYIQSTI